MVEATGAESEPDRSRACPHCGWQGAKGAMRGVGVGDPAGDDLACPRCGAAVAPDLPSVPEILSARRTPLPEG